jgi:hypothetical protein
MEGKVVRQHFWKVFASVIAAFYRFSSFSIGSSA